MGKKGKVDETVGHIDHEIVPQELIGSQLQTTITVIGAGGTGSHLIEGLARMDQALRMLGHNGLYVTMYDQDTVEPHNIGRQKFGFNHIGQNKAMSLIAEVNRKYLVGWQASGRRFVASDVAAGRYGNIVVTAVDHNATRNDIHKRFRDSMGMSNLKRIMEQEHETAIRTFYWMDIGNDKDYGQVVLGSEGLMDCVEVKGGPYDETVKDTPSCSAAESLRSQDLFINQVMAAHALDTLWQIFRKGVVRTNVIYVNLDPERYSVKGTFKHLRNAIPAQEKECQGQRQIRSTARA